MKNSKRIRMVLLVVVVSVGVFTGCAGKDEEVARLNLPGITTFLELKNHVCSIVNANDGLIELMKVGDAYMNQVVAKSDYNEIPEQVIMDCEKIYNDYLSEMRAEYNDFVEFPPMEEPENPVQKVLAAMAIAHENGIDRDGFQYREVLEYVLKLNVK